MLILVSFSDNRIIFRTEYTVIGSTYPRIILWSEKFSSLNSKYVYDEIAFDSGELESDFL